MYTPGKLGGVVRLAYQNLYLTYDQNLRFTLHVLEPHIRPIAHISEYPTPPGAK